MEKLLVIEDDIGIQTQLKWTFDCYDIVFAKDKDSALSAFRRFSPQVVTLDLGLPPESENVSEGFATLKAMLALNPSCKVIVITANDDKQHALEAIKLGAHDFYSKPVNDDELLVMIKRAFFIAAIEANNSIQLAESQDSPILGNSQAINHIRAMIAKVAPTELTTLLLGESGTGKDLIAREIHQQSPRKDAPFIAINCASIPENLLESELFGYEKGAFTGAVKTTKGKIESAHGGTLFLDEIGDMYYPLQAKILRFLQDKQIERVGGRKTISLDVRIICATNQNLHSMVAEKTFREDLFYRISELVIDIAPLRKRGEDVLILSRMLLKHCAAKLGKNILGFSEEATQALLAYQWPGNIRELQNKIKTASLMCDDKNINAHDLGLQQAEKSSAALTDINLKTVREKAEKEAIKKVITYCDGNLSHAAKELGVTRPTLYYLLDKYRLNTIKTSVGVE